MDSWTFLISYYYLSCEIYKRILVPGFGVNCGTCKNCSVMSWQCLVIVQWLSFCVLFYTRVYVCYMVHFKHYFVCPDSECIRVFLVYNVIWRANPKQVHWIFFRMLRGYCVLVNFNVKCATDGMKSSWKLRKSTYCVLRWYVWLFKIFVIFSVGYESDVYEEWCLW